MPLDSTTGIDHGCGCGCGQPTKPGSSFIRGHSSRMRSTPFYVYVERFWSQVDKRGADECWMWKAGRDKDGYGRFRAGHPIKSHQFAYQVAIGPVPDGVWVCHSCDNPPCCNPTHLWLGTSDDNIADRCAKGRSRAGRGATHGTHTHPERRARGEHHGIAKLTDQAVREIRLRYAQGKISQKRLAEQYGVAQMAVCKIVRDEAWTHVI